MKSEQKKIDLRQRISKIYKKPELYLLQNPKLFPKPTKQMRMTGSAFYSSAKSNSNIQQKQYQKRVQAVTSNNWFSFSSSPQNLLKYSEQNKAKQQRKQQSISKRKPQIHRKIYTRKYSPYVKNQKQYEKLMIAMKPVKGPTDSIIQQIKQHNENNKKNVQNVLLATKDSFKQKLTKYSSRIGLRNNEKIFIMNSKDHHIRQALQRNGWVEAMDLSSSFFHLKWTYTDSPADYQNIQDGQFFNHFKNNQQLTNKYLLKKNINNSSVQIKPNYPITFDFQRREDQIKFQSQFTKFQCFNTLNKLHEFIITNFENYYNKLNCLGILQGKQLKLNVQKMRQKNYLLKFQPKNIQQNEKQIRQALYQFWYKMLQSQSSQQDNKIKNRKSSKRIIINSHNTSANKINDTLIQILQHNKQNLICVLNKDKFILYSIIVLYNKVKHKFANSFGVDNWWIVKPTGVSRGSGITIQRDYFKIIKNKYGKIAQKYIQKPLLLSCNRKFDIRQWVLVKSFVPLQAYIYQKCYCRFSAQKYNSQNHEQLSVHLTNYSKQKQQYQKIGNNTQSIMSQQNLQKQIDNITKIGKWKQIKQQIKQQIIKTLKCCQYQIQQKIGCFQVYGFDILLDRVCKPWVLQVNLSPACQKRGDFLSQYLYWMAEGIIDIVEDRDIRYWEKLQENMYINSNSNININSNIYNNTSIYNNTNTNTQNNLNVTSFLIIQQKQLKNTTKTTNKQYPNKLKQISKQQAINKIQRWYRKYIKNKNKINNNNKLSNKQRIIQIEDKHYHKLALVRVSSDDI